MLPGSSRSATITSRRLCSFAPSRTSGSQLIACSASEARPEGGAGADVPALRVRRPRDDDRGRHRHRRGEVGSDRLYRNRAEASPHELLGHGLRLGLVLRSLCRSMHANLRLPAESSCSVGPSPWWPWPSWPDFWSSSARCCCCWCRRDGERPPPPCWRWGPSSWSGWRSRPDGGAGRCADGYATLRRDTAVLGRCDSTDVRFSVGGPVDIGAMTTARPDPRSAAGDAHCPRPPTGWAC
jgi:hypothetical protein